MAAFAVRFINRDGKVKYQQDIYGETDLDGAPRLFTEERHAKAAAKRLYRWHKGVEVVPVRVVLET